MNYILGQTQLEQIHYLLLLYYHEYRYEKIKNIIIMNEQKCIEWCRKFRFIQQPQSQLQLQQNNYLSPSNKEFSIITGF